MEAVIEFIKNATQSILDISKKLNSQSSKKSTETKPAAKKKSALEMFNDDFPYADDEPCSSISPGQKGNKLPCSIPYLLTFYSSLYQVTNQEMNFSHHCPPVSPIHTLFLHMYNMLLYDGENILSEDMAVMMNVRKFLNMPDLVDGLVGLSANPSTSQGHQVKKGSGEAI